MSNMQAETDLSTAQAFASSWNNLPQGSVYTKAQVLDWFEPLSPHAFSNKRILEMGCGNGSLLVHALDWEPKEITGIDLGESVKSAQQNCSKHPLAAKAKILQADLVGFNSEGFDIVYSIGVLHHLKKPRDGFRSVIRNTKPGGLFHCWVYGKEGNMLVRLLVEPLRKLVCHAPWWITKYFFATPLAIPFFLYSRFISAFHKLPITRLLPMYSYMMWISKRDFLFCRHVAFDQLVTPQTIFLSEKELRDWLNSEAGIEDSYLIQRNGNSWKFGGKKKC
jgi:SAM-dependent methyltransferase